LFVVFAGGDAFDFDESLEDIAEFTVVDEAEVFDIGEIIADVASAEEDIKEVLGLDGERWRGFRVEDGENGGLELMADDAGGRFGVGVVEIAD